MAYSVTFVLLLASVFLLSGLAVIGFRNRSEPSARLFAVLQSVSAVWAGLTTVGLVLSPGYVRIRIWGIATGISLIVIVLWLGFILRYTGRERWLNSRWFSVAAAPLLVGSLLYCVVPTWRPLVGNLDVPTIPAGTVVEAAIGPVGAGLGLYIYSVFALGVVLVVKTLLEGEAHFTGQGIALVLGTLVTVVASALEIAGIPAPGYPVTEVALSGQSVLWGYAVFRQQFLSVVPAVGRIGERAVFDELDDGVAIVDNDGVITRANPRLRAALDVDDLIGRPVDRLFTEVGVSAFAELPTRFRCRGRTYQAKASMVTNWRGREIGHALVVRDVTRLVRRQQRLEVLNRVFRHNVRNHMSIVLGIGDRLQARDDGDLDALGETLAEHADTLMTISEKALQIERVFERSRVVETVDLGEFLEKRCGPLREAYPEATVTVTATAGELTTDPQLLSFAVREAVENAVQHAGNEPTVEIEAARSNDEVRLTIRDDGPGIPASEVDPVLTGEETDLHHASSLGLWLIRWGTEAIEGDIDVDSSDGGATVRLTLPDLEDGHAETPIQE